MADPEIHNINFVQFFFMFQYYFFLFLNILILQRINLQRAHFVTRKSQLLTTKIIACYKIIVFNNY